MLRYGIYDEDLGWIKQDGSLIASNDRQELRDAFPFGEVRRFGILQLLGSKIHVKDAYRRSEPRVRVATTTPEGVDQIMGTLNEIRKMGNRRSDSE